MALQKEKEEEALPRTPTPRPILSPPKQPLFSSNVAVAMRCSSSREEQKVEKEEEEEEEEDDEEDHFRHRRLTGDSGIEVCRCHVKRGEEQQEEELQKKAVKEAERAGALHDSADCSMRAPDSSSAARGIQKTGENIIRVQSS